MSEHELILKNNGVAVCSCGDEFEGRPGQAVKLWETHLEILDLLEDAREQNLTERVSRNRGEIVVRRLLDLGVSSHKISKAIGNDPTGALMMSPTLIQRLGKNSHEQTPRRRKRL